MDYKKHNQSGFALILSMVMLIAMTLMGTVLVMNASNQSKITGISESNNQTFLSSETGIEAAMRWLDDKADKNLLLLIYSVDLKVSLRTL